MLSFMMEIDAERRSPLDQLAIDYCHIQRMACPSIDFCHKVFGVPEDDEVVARRLRVSIETVRKWREVGQRVHPMHVLGTRR